jgi:hypothetical protein
LTHGLATFAKTGVAMPDYEELLTFLAENPPELAAERELHASLLEMIAKGLRSGAGTDEASSEAMPQGCIRWTDIN